MLAPEESYVDPTDNAGGVDEPQPGESYRYYLRAVNNNGFTPFDPAPDVDLDFLAPANVEATDGLFGDKVIVTWDRSFPADGYRIYRDDDSGAPVATVGDVVLWEDDQLADTDSHTYWVQAYDSARDIASPLSAEDTGYVDAVPVPNIDTDISSGIVPITVNFDASLSADPDATDTIVKYEWDYDGSPGYDTTRFVPDFTWTFSSPRTYDVKLRLTDDEGTTAEATLQITVDAWPSQVVDDPGKFVLDTSLAIVNGRPAIAYHARTDAPEEEQLRYVRANNPQGSSWGVPLTLETGGGGVGVGLSSELVVVNGKPAILYRRGAGVKYIHATDADGTAWEPAQQLGTQDGGCLGLAVVGFFPAVAFFSGGSLAYKRALDVDGTTWQIGAEEVDSGTIGEDLSLAEVDGNPALCYFEYDDDDLRYIRADDPSGLSWGVPQVIDANNASTFCSLAIVNGNPAVSYQANGMVSYSRAIDTVGGNWNEPVWLGNGNASELAVVAGRPCVAWGGPNMRWADDADGAAWPWPAQFTLDNIGGSYLSLAEVSGQPGVCYVTFANTLKYMRRPDA